MKSFLVKSVIIGLVSTVISSAAMANNSLAPVGILQASSNIIIQNELGAFSVSGDYSVLADDQIQTGDDITASLSIEGGGHIYVGPNSSITVRKSGNNHIVNLSNGSIGYKVDGSGSGSGKVTIVTSEQKVEPVSDNGIASGAIATGPDNRLVINPTAGSTIATTHDGIVTLVEQGETWTNIQSEAKLVPAQVIVEEEVEEDSAAVLWSVAGFAALAALAISNSDSDGSIPGSGSGSGSGSGTGSLPLSATGGDGSGGGGGGGGPSNSPS